jgi:putative RNA 2'-phosphotransferase
VLKVLAGMMQREGRAFLQADNGVWLTAFVPAAFLAFAKPDTTDDTDG